MVISNSYVSLPEGISRKETRWALRQVFLRFLVLFPQKVFHETHPVTGFAKDKKIKNGESVAQHSRSAKKIAQRFLKR